MSDTYVSYDEHYQGVYGAQLVAPSGETQVNVLRPATYDLVQWARHFWREADEADFEWDLGKHGMRVRDKATGELYRISLGHPGAPEESGVVCFVVRGGRLVLLEKPGAERPRSVYVGHVIERRIDPKQPGRMWAPSEAWRGIG